MSAKGHTTGWRVNLWNTFCRTGNDLRLVRFSITSWNRAPSTLIIVFIYERLTDEKRIRQKNLQKSGSTNLWIESSKWKYRLLISKFYFYYTLTLQKFWCDFGQGYFSDNFTNLNFQILSPVGIYLKKNDLWVNLAAMNWKVFVKEVKYLTSRKYRLANRLVESSSSAGTNGSCNRRVNLVQIWNHSRPIQTLFRRELDWGLEYSGLETHLGAISKFIIICSGQNIRLNLFTNVLLVVQIISPVYELLAVWSRAEPTHKRFWQSNFDWK